MTKQLRDRVISGEWPPGTLLPSEAHLRHEYGVGIATLRRAVAALRTEGLVDVERGYGTRVREQRERTTVSVQRGSMMDIRMPTPEERERLDIPEGVPVAVVAHGTKTTIYPGDRNLFHLK